MAQSKGSGCMTADHKKGFLNYLGEAQVLSAQTDLLVYEKVTAPCMAAAWNGATEMVKSSIKNIPSALSSLWQTGVMIQCLIAVDYVSDNKRKCFLELKQKTMDTAHLLWNLRAKMAEAFDDFSGLEPEIQGQLVCSFLGNVGLGGAASFVTRGAMKSEAGLAALAYFKNLKMAKALLQRKGSDLNLEQRVLLAKNLNKYSEDELAMMNFFDQAGYPKLVNGLLACTR